MLTRKTYAFLPLILPPEDSVVAILEGPNRLIDWGVKEMKANKNAKSLKLIADLIERYKPSRLLKNSR